MTREGWRTLVLDAVRRHESDDSELLDLLSKVLEEQDLAKQRFRDIGVGCTGMPWRTIVDTVEEIKRWH